MASVSEAAAAAHAERPRDRLERKASTIDHTILSPGTVAINVQGAFIVDADPFNPPTPSDDGAQHDTDIRLPNHISVVSHVALDASLPHVENIRKVRILISTDWWLAGKTRLFLTRAGLQRSWRETEFCQV